MTHIFSRIGASVFSIVISISYVQAQHTPAAPPPMVPAMTEFWEPAVKVVAPGLSTSPPSDAIILFNGSDISQWETKSGGPAKWKVSNGIMTAVKGAGNISTKLKFEDFQLHAEWMVPVKTAESKENNGNSGIYLQGLYEVQIWNSYEVPLYANGQAGSIYKQSPPLVNATRKPGEWNVYDVIYTAPRFKENGALFSPARVTVTHNGVVIQNNTEITGSTVYIGNPRYTPHGKGPILLQDHGDAVSYRNIWIREL